MTYCVLFQEKVWFHRMICYRARVYSGNDNNQLGESLFDQGWSKLKLHQQELITLHHRLHLLSSGWIQSALLAPGLLLFSLKITLYRLWYHNLFKKEYRGSRNFSYLYCGPKQILQLIMPMLCCLWCCQVELLRPFLWPTFITVMFGCMFGTGKELLLYTPQVERRRAAFHLSKCRGDSNTSHTSHTMSQPTHIFLQQ
jgi:hypothetical protein